MRRQIEGFRGALNLQKYGADGLEAQQLELRKRIPPIHNAVRNKSKAYIKALQFRYKVKSDDKTKTDFERLEIALEGLPERWGFSP